MFKRNVYMYYSVLESWNRVVRMYIYRFLDIPVSARNTEIDIYASFNLRTRKTINIMSSDSLVSEKLVTI